MNTIYDVFAWKSASRQRMLNSVNTALRSVVCALILVVLAFVALDYQGWSAAEWLLTPGYILPERYWGGVHDPLQILVVLVLNVVFYSAVLSIAIWLWTKVGHTVTKDSKRL